MKSFLFSLFLCSLIRTFAARKRILIVYQTYTLSNGLRIICARSESEVAYCGIAVDAGTRDELPGEDGLAHFVEHLSFKGTLRRSARQIITRMESVGGDLNAFTDKEETVYYCTTLRQHLGRALELLLDITLCSTFPQQEVEREVEVVIDEIESYNDQPSELIYDEFESLLFPGHPLGRNILGSADRLRQFVSSDLQRFVRRLYRPERMVLFVYGRVDIEEVVRMVEKASPPTPLRGEGGPSEATDEEVATNGSPLLGEGLGVRLFTVSRSTHQAHVMIGTRTFAATDPRYYALFLLNNLLGGPAMSSRLNTSLRERHGLVYSVESNMASYTDAGLWRVYFGCDHHDVKRCARLVVRELKRLCDAPLSQRTLDAARRQMKGQLGIAWDNPESVAIGMAKRFLHYGTTLTMAQQMERLDALTPDILWQTAQDILSPDGMTMLAFTETTSSSAPHQ
ncbi:MAG: insulinase family protein [Bacteroidaceae bacterium]|nr:insulinase family protein [Bacteroidaceae bacterium]